MCEEDGAFGVIKIMDTASTAITNDVKSGSFVTQKMCYIIQLLTINEFVSDKQEKTHSLLPNNTCEQKNKP